MKIFSIKQKLGVLVVALAGMVLTGCMDDIEVTRVATQGQINNSSPAIDGLVQAMPAKLTELNDSLANKNNWHGCFGYGSMMYVRDMMTGDIALNGIVGYGGHFLVFSRDQTLGEDYIFAGYIWSYYYGTVLAANNVIRAIDPETATSDLLGYYLGAAYAFRALCYIDMARMYEFLPNDKFPNGVNADGNNVTNLTVPIVDEKMDEETARNNPRVSHEKMFEFILSDLDKAEKYISTIPNPNTNGKTLPDLACVYGLKARLYMWNEDYQNAEKYARLAIDNAGISPMNEEDCLNTATGFNDISKWMWGGTQNSESATVQTGIVNWTSWVSNQTTFGYTGVATGMYTYIDKNMYDRISNTDFRKKEWVAPEGSALDGQNSYIAGEEGWFPEYVALKFRPNEGNAEAYSIGAASSIPVMRVEEMYFIEAEAAAHQDPARGLKLLEDFMKTYRDPQYTYTKSVSVDDVVEEIIFQKRVELWGEGQTYFDIKRLNYSVKRAYKGSPFESLSLFDTNGRPAWMNIVISRNETQYNAAIKGYNNPDPSGLYQLESIE